MSHTEHWGGQIIRFLLSSLYCIAQCSFKPNMHHFIHSSMQEWTWYSDKDNITKFCCINNTQEPQPSVDTIGELYFSLTTYPLCFNPSAQPHDFTSPDRFYFRNNKYCNDLYFCLFVSSICFTGFTSFRVCHCRNSFNTAFAPVVPCCSTPLFYEYCVRTVDTRSPEAPIFCVVLYVHTFADIWLCWAILFIVTIQIWVYEFRNSNGIFIWI